MNNRTTVIDTSNYPVMSAQCKTCPFRTDNDGRHPDTALVQKIQHQVITEASQICHHPSLYGQEETHLCRGARDYQLTIFYLLGVIDSPTDEAWNRLKNSLIKGRAREKR